MKSKPKVSIITVCFNSAETIRDTIESVLKQTYENIEYIIVDGGSTDGTIDIIRSYLPRFSGRLFYISESDNGIYDAMNKGLRLTTGSIIGIINSDDSYEPDAVRRVVEQTDVDKCQVIYGYCRMFGGHLPDKIMINHHTGLSEAMIPHPTCFVTRKTYSRYGMFVKCLKIVADYELMLRFWKKGVEFIQVKEVQANFRRGGISSTKRTEWEKRIVRFVYKPFI